MNKICVEKEGSLIIPRTLKAGTSTEQGSDSSLHGSESQSKSADKLPSLSSTQALNKPDVHRLSSNRQNGYAHKTQPYGAPGVVKQMYPGKQPATYFSNMTFGRFVSPRASGIGTPTTKRTVELWEPRRPSREKARHALRNIQDARFRKQDRLDTISESLEKRGRRMTETALLREAVTMPRGLQAFLMKNEREKENAEARIQERRERLQERKERRRNNIT